MGCPGALGHHRRGYHAYMYLCIHGVAWHQLQRDSLSPADLIPHQWKVNKATASLLGLFHVFHIRLCDFTYIPSLPWLSQHCQLFIKCRDQKMLTTHGGVGTKIWMQVSVLAQTTMGYSQTKSCLSNNFNYWFHHNHLTFSHFLFCLEWNLYLQCMWSSSCFLHVYILALFLPYFSLCTVQSIPTFLAHSVLFVIQSTRGGIEKADFGGRWMKLILLLKSLRNLVHLSDDTPSPHVVVKSRDATGKAQRAGFENMVGART